jgi:hypothetical protein
MGHPSPFQPQVDRDALRKGDPEEVASNAYDALLKGLEGLPGDDVDEKLLLIPRPGRAVYTTLMLQFEVENGGHHQFFWNSEGRWNDETRADLELIDAWPFVRIFAEAVSIYESHDYAEEKSSSRNTWDAFTAGYREKRMEALDTQFYNEPKSISAFLGEFIRRNIEAFAG